MARTGLAMTGYGSTMPRGAADAWLAREAVTE